MKINEKLGIPEGINKQATDIFNDVMSKLDSVKIPDDYWVSAANDNIIHIESESIINWEIYNKLNLNKNKNIYLVIDFDFDKFKLK